MKRPQNALMFCCKHSCGGELARLTYGYPGNYRVTWVCDQCRVQATASHRDDATASRMALRKLQNAGVRVCKCSSPSIKKECP